MLGVQHDRLREIPDDVPRTAVIDYTNWKGNRRERRIKPHRWFFGTHEPYHTEPQWLMWAYDLDDRAWRCFTMRGINGWADGADASAMCSPG